MLDRVEGSRLVTADGRARPRPGHPATSPSSVAAPEVVLRLQRQAGNRAVAAAASSASLDLPGRQAAPGPTLPVQRLRTTPPDRMDEPVHQQFRRFASRAGFGAGIQDPDAKAAAQWASMRETYRQALDKGSRHFGDLKVAVMACQASPTRYAADRAELRKGYDERYREHYTSTLAPEPTGPGTRVTTRGFVASPDELTGSGLPPYSNIHDPRAGTIGATSNFADKDLARVGKVGLPNSEILWQQHLQAARPLFSVFAETRARDLAANIRRITRMNIQNATTLTVAFMACPDGVPLWSGNLRYSPDQEEFRALLGTPNVVPAVMLLIDHMDEVGGRTIAGLGTTPKEYIDIDIVAAEKTPMEVEMTDFAGVG